MNSIFIPGPVGRLELLISAEQTHSKNGVAIICHPHPLFGGAMHNKVVTTLARTFESLGLVSVRFNYRGVGKSEGTYGEGKGEIEDLLVVMSWANAKYPGSELWLAGFSFGACVAASAAVLHDTAQLILVAPAVQHFSLNDLPPLQSPCLVIQGEQDEIVHPNAVYQWVASRDPQPMLIRLPDAGHFFHGQLMVLREKLIEIFHLLVGP